MCNKCITLCDNFQRMSLKNDTETIGQFSTIISCYKYICKDIKSNKTSY